MIIIIIIITLAYLQLLDDVLVVPGVAGGDGPGRPRGGLVVGVRAGQRVEGGARQHDADLSLQVQRKRDGATLSWRSTHDEQ